MSGVTSPGDPFTGKSAIVNNGEETVFGGDTDIVFSTSTPGILVLLCVYSADATTTGYAENKSEIDGVLDAGTKHDGVNADFYYYLNTTFSTLDFKIKNGAGSGKTFKWFYLIYQ